MNNIVKSTVVLFTVSAVCVMALAYVNEITTEPIKAQEILAENAAFEELFPSGDEFVKGEKSVPVDSVITDIVSAYSGGNLAGYVVRLDQKGYGGTISMMTGFDLDGVVTGITILSHSETPGLGAICEDPSFTGKFAGKSAFPIEVIKSGTPAENEIDAITSATITTKAVTDAVNTAYEWFVSEGGGN